MVLGVDRVNLTIRKGDIFGIVGYSGAGKSSVLRCINLLEKPTSGKVVVDGVDLTSLSKEELRVARQKKSDDLPALSFDHQQNGVRERGFRA